MARPWKKTWPYVGRGGRKSYRVGFRDHEGRERTKAFPSAKHANEWMDAYVAAERRGSESLRRFLLDLDAKEANVGTSTRTIGEVIELYLAFNAPDTEDGLARSTFKTYRHSASRHLLGLPGSSRGKPLKPAKHAVRFASEDAARFNEPAAPRALREALRHAQVGTSARAHAWRVLSAVLSWAAGSEFVPEIEVNGCLLANEKIGNRRKSMRAGNGQATLRRRGEAVRSWALSPTSVELVRAEMLSRVDHVRRPIVAHRDAMIVSLQFGLALRNQEVYGFRWANLVTGGRAHITDVLGWDEVEASGKTERATGRIACVPEILTSDLHQWRILLMRHGYRTRGEDFVIPGDLTGAQHGVVEDESGACHMSINQAKQWRARYMQSAVEAVAESDPALASLRGATPYSLRRGGISARLRGESAQSVADQCGTSLEMLSQHYSYEIDEYGRGGPESLDAQWRRARTAVAGRSAVLSDFRKAA